MRSDRPQEVAAPGRVFTDIVCAVDGTRSSIAAARMAAELAGPAGRLTLLAVTAESGAGPHASALISRDRAESVLHYTRELAAAAGVRASMVVDPAGPPVRVILDRAAAHDLLVVGAPVRSQIAGALVRGVAETALESFTTPLLVVRRSAAGPLDGRTIIAASAGDEGSDELVELAARWGAEQGAHVVLVNALGAESAMRPHRVSRQVGTIEKLVGERCEPRIAPGNAREVIVAAARESEAAIVVIGSRRLSGLRALGSVSRQIVRDAPCSVLVLPPR